MSEQFQTCKGHRVLSPFPPFFELPHVITQELKECAERHKSGCSAPEGTVEYLWLNLAGGALESDDINIPTQKPLSLEEWLSVIDEAAALGVHCLLVCVGDDPSEHPQAWELCRWAQDAHDMMVGLHLHGHSLGDIPVKELRTLNGDRMCIFASGLEPDMARDLEKIGFQVCEARVAEQDHPSGCTMPGCMVFVGPEGAVYTCGLVFGNKSYCLGNVLDKRLSEVIEDESLPHTVEGYPGDRYGHSCDGCPPLMVKRISRILG